MSPLKYIYSCTIGLASEVMKKNCELFYIKKKKNVFTDMS